MHLDSSISRIKETFENWAMYEAVVRNNYMFHNELVSGLKSIAAEVSGGLRIVDLAVATRGWPRAPFAISRSTRTWESISPNRQPSGGGKTPRRGIVARLICGNIVDCVAVLPNESANLILASNSLHHFSSADKATIVEHCFRILQPAGILCWVDPVVNEGESLDAYLRRLRAPCSTIGWS